MSWRVAKSLEVLLAELDAAAPHRSKVSDGSIGDASHASRTSDHNPWVTFHGVGIVRARDFTHDPAGGLDCNKLAAALVALMLAGHAALTSGAYVIWQRRIFSFDRRSEGWRPYSGSNPHDHHLHLSVATAATGFDTTRPWGVMEDDMNEQETRTLVREELAAAIDKAVSDLAEELRAEVRGRDAKWSLQRILNWLVRRSEEQGKKIAALERRLERKK